MSDVKNKGNVKKKRVPNWGHIIPVAIGAIILIAIVVIVIRVAIWNRGEVAIIDPEDAANVGIETEDMLYLMPPSIVWGEEDDGEINIVMFGNDTLHTSYNGKTLADLVAEELDVTIYNISFPGTFLSSETTGTFLPEENPVNAFSFYWLTSNLRTGDYSLQEKALEYLPEGYDREDFRKTLDLLKSIDFNKIDIMMICYDGHDYLNQRVPDIYGDVYNVSTMQGSIAATIYNCEVNFPNMQYVFVAPVFCFYIDENGNREGCDLKNFGYGNMPTGLTPIHNLDAVYTLSYLDLFYGVNINTQNADEYLTEDGITPNKKGIQAMADRIVRMIGGRLRVES